MFPWIVFSILHIISESKRPTSKHRGQVHPPPFNSQKSAAGRYCALSTPCSPSGPEEKDTPKPLIPSPTCDYLQSDVQAETCLHSVVRESEESKETRLIVFNIPMFHMREVKVSTCTFGDAHAHPQRKRIARWLSNTNYAIVDYFSLLIGVV